LTYGIIYCITNKLNSKRYVGLTTRSVTERFKEHEIADSYIGRAIRKYGIENFSIMILDDAENREELVKAEIYWINELNTFDDGYNLTTGGDGVIVVDFFDIELDEKQEKFVNWVRKENNKKIDVHNRKEMTTMVMINLAKSFLISDNDRDKKLAAKQILKLKPIYLSELLRKRLFTKNDLLSWV